MLEQTIKIESADAGAAVTITMRIVDGKLVELKAKGGEGADYAVALQLTPAGATDVLRSLNLCCCPDPVLGLVCREIDGPCPAC